MKKFLALSPSDDVFIMLINVKIPTISMKKKFYNLEKSFITSGPDRARRVWYFDTHVIE